MPELRLKSLTFSDRGPYNLTIKPGQCVCITGVSGSGKTLLLRSIADLDIHQGEVYLDEQETNSVPAYHWRKLVGMLPAESRWWADTVKDHFPDQNQDILEQMGFTGDVLNWQVKRLSTGERQRLAIARLLNLLPKALLLDEPTASLDEENVHRVENLVRQYMTSNNVPVLWVSHDKQQVERIADRHFILSQSGLTEQEVKSK